MSHNAYDHSCHGVALDTFMRVERRDRWREVKDFFPHDYKNSHIEVMRVDDSWIGLRSLENMTEQEWDSMAVYNPLAYVRFRIFRLYFNKRSKKWIKHPLETTNLSLRKKLTRHWRKPGGYQRLDFPKKDQPADTEEPESEPAPYVRVAMHPAPVRPNPPELPKSTPTNRWTEVPATKGAQIVAALRRNGYTRIATGCWARLNRQKGSPISISFFHHTVYPDKMVIQAIFDA